MIRVPCPERTNWQSLAGDYGFKFHTMYGEKYWDESAYYQFTLKQIEEQIEEPTEEIHQMCLAVVDKVVKDEELMKRFCIQEKYWDQIADSWKRNDPSLYSRIDLVYDGKNPAKFLENNADTPTSLYESGFWQWLWLENQVDSGVLNRQCDQFNSLQDELVKRFHTLGGMYPGKTLHFSSCKDTEEDRGTVQYMQDCAEEAGLACKFVDIEDIGLGKSKKFTDMDSEEIEFMFKLYPWEFMFEEKYGNNLKASNTQWLEPMWKSLLSNKALLPVIWDMFKGHPNLLPAFFEDGLKGSGMKDFVKKPIFSREGGNISVFKDGKEHFAATGPYGQEGFVYQAYTKMPMFGDNHTLLGSWLINDKACGMSVREDKCLVTQDLSRFLPHVIL